jgi:hypothetical protein
MKRIKLLMFVLVGVLAGCGTMTIPIQEDAAKATAQQTPQVQRSLNEMISAYQSKDLQRFGTYVSEGYFSDKMRLMIRVSRDFRVLDDILIHLEIHSISEDERGRVFVEAAFDRSHTDRSLGRRVNQAGTVSLLFELENGHYRLLSQRPALFGVR